MSEPRGVHDAHDEEMTQQEVDAAMNSREHTLWQLGSILGTDHPVMVFMQNEEAGEILAAMATLVRRADFLAQQGAAHPDLGLRFDFNFFGPDSPLSLLDEYYAARLAEAQREQASPV